jgi:DNA-binding NarL/FixJ family response regulator
LLLSKRADIEIVGESNNGKHLLQSLAENNIDLAITDLKMPGMDGLELMSSIKKNYPAVKLLVVSMSDEMEIIYRLFLAETDGYILKTADRHELFTAIDDILDDKIHYQKSLLAKIIQRQKAERQHSSTITLSKREKEILDLVMQEKTSNEIANTLFISKQTVDTHRKNIYAKINVNTLVGLIKFALRMNWIGE